MREREHARDTHNVPVGLGIGRVLPPSSAVFSVFVEPQFTILDPDPGQPEPQILVGLATQLVKG